jgi:hypothetical protein
VPEKERRRESEEKVEKRGQREEQKEMIDFANLFMASTRRSS